MNGGRGEILELNGLFIVFSVGPLECGFILIKDSFAIRLVAGVKNYSPTMELTLQAHHCPKWKSYSNSRQHVFPTFKCKKNDLVIEVI